MGELFAEFGDLVFTLVIGYISAIEFLYVVRHLYHYSFNHDDQGYADDGESLSQLQDSMRQQLINAKNREALAGTQVMKDGVPYKDGFRLEAQQSLIEQLKEQLKDKELSDLRRQELEKELAKQMKIADQLRKELAEAEAKYERQLKLEEEERAKKLKEEQQKREKEEQAKKEAEEQARKLKEAEKQREAEQRKREQEEQAKKEAEEQARKLQEAEKQREAEQRKRDEEERVRKEAEQQEKEKREREEQARREAEEQALKLAEAERQREAEQRQREEAENARKLIEAEQQREAEENARRIAEAEKQREIEQQQREKAEEAEKQREAEQRKHEEAEAEENARRLLEIEKSNEERQAAEEAEAEAKKLLEIEHRLEEQLRAAEREAELTEKERQLIESIKQRDLPQDEGNEQKEAELLRKILEAREQLGEESEEEQSLRLIQRERDQEAKQKRIEENALLFLEAEKEMAELQAKMLDAVEKKEFTSSLDSAPQTPAVEEPCIKRTVSPLMGGETVHHTVKTQLAQDLDEPYSVSSKTLLFPGVSDDASSIDPASSQQSSFSTQPSEEITTGTDSQYPQQERQEPDGEDTALNNLQYSDDYLRSLDGIKQRPLVREDGSGRRRAFKKRRSSNSSNSSRESRHSRDEELKMFTSLEEEEMKDTADSEFTPIRYTSEPTLKVKGHHRRHKRSPAKDMRHGDDSLRSSLERLGEETSDPWGEVKPEHYKHTEFWKREKTLSIDEETEFEKPASSEEVAYDTATNMPSASSFEEATQMQNEEALTALQRHSANWEGKERESDNKATAKEETTRSDNTNLQTSQTAERKASPARSSASPRLRRSPRIEEIDQYEERWNKGNDSSPSSTQNTPTISVQTPLDFGPWRDEYGLMMEGLSSFYDFQASVNPSRSRSASRNPSPANTAPNTPLPKDVSFQLEISNEESNTVEVYDDTGDLDTNEFKKENIIKFIDSINGNEDDRENKEETEIESASEDHVGLKHHIQLVADDQSSSEVQKASLVPLVNVIEDVTVASSSLEVTESTDIEMNDLVRSLRSQQAGGRSRSRSKSPLPTPGNLQRSLENRRYKMIKHNEDILEKLIESKLLPELSPAEQLEEQSKLEKKDTLETKEETETNTQEEMNSLVQTLRVDRGRSRSKSPMRLPTAENLSKGLEKRRSKLIERNDELIKQIEERSQTPESPTVTVEYVYELEGTEETNISTLNTPTISFESPQNEASVSPTEEEDDCSREKMNLLVETLRAARSRSSSRSPMRLAEGETINQTYYQFQQSEEVNVRQQTEILNAPTISIDFAESDHETKTSPKLEDDCSRQEMDLLVQSLRMARSRSTSKSPMRLPATDNNNLLLQHMTERAKTPEPSAFNEFESEERDRHSRSRTPSRSHSKSRSPSLPPRPYEAELAAFRSKTPSRSVSPQPEEYDEIHALSLSTEENELLILANRQKQLDEEALEKLKTASEEMELRTLSPLILDKDELSEQQGQDLLADLPITERAKLLRKSPTTPDYDRTISEEMRDIERIKQERLERGFQRSTYVGESMDLGSEFEPLRREAAHFKRSRSPSPSFSGIDVESAKKAAEEKRQLQDIILQELTTTSSSTEPKNTGAIPKTDRLSSCEIELTLTNEIEDTIRIKEEMLNIGVQSPMDDLEEMRRRNAEFRRSGSASRSPLNESQLQELASIETAAAKRELKDKVIHEIACTTMNFQDFSRHLNTDFFATDRRASDSALIQKPEILVQLHEDIDMEPEEYHHFRRFSLAQEQPEETYPSDDYVFIQEVEVRTRSGSRTWLREDFYSEEVDKYLAKSEEASGSSAERENIDIAEVENVEEAEENVEANDDDEEYSNASDDDRQTVVEVDDEIDEDISDFNERGPAEESHHETSECEEAEREMDRYADREASDWNRVVDVDDIVVNENPANELVTSEEDEGAVGGLSNSPYDSDSFAIDQIYDEAIKNRKQSGILREYDSILMQMSVSSDVDEQYLLWSKTQGKKKPKNIEFNTQFLDNERKESEMRYLGDANVTARQSARLRSRYGYNPVLQAKCIDDDLEVDLNYKPKREYNWRKNFKLEEEDIKEDKEVTLKDLDFGEEQVENEQTDKLEQVANGDEEQEVENIDKRKYSIGGESVTLFSQSPEKDRQISEDLYKDTEEPVKEELKEEKVEKPKKKKTKKKLHKKESKDSLEETMNREDEDVYDNEMYNRRSSSIQMETDSPKRKSRSRRSSRSSITNEDSLGLFSPRSSVAYNEPINDIMEESTDMAKETSRPKKMKKRKKVKEPMADVAESPIETKEELQYSLEALNDIPAVSTVITPNSSSANILSTLSPQNSICVTPGSIETDISLSVEELREEVKEATNSSNTTSSSTTASSPSGNLSRTSSIVTTPVDTFDILKDANFYPLF
ncbi:trichohyalin isoform X1 [Lucilia sericata]|uniref:trichohyalin isoform X1 n=1 Tax=Lucilia sericata TaxID=13632 RepID=UPI0018A86CBE|nr:trichohyalin isoform X1 [Lucilia sericata]